MTRLEFFTVLGIIGLIFAALALTVVGAIWLLGVVLKRIL